MKIQAHRIRITTPQPIRWYADKVGRQFWAEYVGSDFCWKVIQEGNTDTPRYVHAFECVVVREAEVEVDLIQTVREIKKCKCDFRTRLVGDGCSVCNPEYAAQFKEDE